jgi:hypothetical protein
MPRKAIETGAPPKNRVSKQRLGSKKAQASKTIERSLLSPTELAMGELTAAFNRAQGGCTDLSKDGRIPHLQASFWVLSNACLITLLRINGLWTRIVDSVPVSDVKLHAALAAEAHSSVRSAISKPMTKNLLDAIAKVGLANDQISALLDRAETRQASDGSSGNRR